ncbi:acyl-CoA dehydrogenase family protein [Lentzea aerocolonigenes]|uniref:acyl-CoA dehydrogenase family protein n=1 Tax=Lentzea aerocolonigenes TaxID=68170 RepID=UPI00055D3352|nr:acyl-CoA dehydrogenase family protein [Lentzea aerocolonigenes]MCP2248084.1 butyryl-CoA dehydrogenase [Lentzea aerocolonigenes]
MSDQAWRAAVRELAEREIRHRSAEMDRTARLDPVLRRELFAAGLMAVEIPRVYGGRGGTLFDAMVCIEEVARVDPGVAVVVDVHNALIVSTILRQGNGDLKRRYLTALARGSIGAFALSEEQAGSDALNLETVAEPVPGGFLLRGRKKWTSSAVHADLFLVFASSPEGKDASAFLVERGTPGLTVAEPTDQLGVRAAATAQLTLDGVRVRAVDAVGGVGAGRSVALEALDIGRLGIAAQMVGLAQGALELSLRYASRREQFGSRINTFQGVQFPIAAVATRLEAARALTYDAVRAIAQGCSPVERLRLTAMAKLFAAEVAEEAAGVAVEVHGGIGYDRAHPVEKLLRDAKAGKIYEGTDNILLRTIFPTLTAPVPVG